MNNVCMVADIHKESQVEDCGIIVTMDTRYPHIPVTNTFMQIIIGIMLFLMLSKVVIKYGGPEAANTIWKNAFVPWIHALIIGPLTIYW